MSRQPSFVVTLVGKSSLLKEGIARILRAANFRILASTPPAQDRSPGKPLPNRQLFLIVHAGDDFEGLIEQIEHFRNRHPSGRIAIVADCYRLDQLISIVRAGAHGYFVDVMTCDVFIKSMELVIMGETIFPPAFLSSILDLEAAVEDNAAVRADSSETIIVAAENLTGEDEASEDTVAPQLSPREKAILRCLIEGDSNKSIARKIDIAEATVKVHIKAILRKIRVQNRTQAAIWAINNKSLARTTIADPAPTRQLRAPETVPEKEQAVAATPPAIIERKMNHTNIDTLDRLMRKATTRFRK